SIILPLGFRDLPDGKLYQYRAAFLIAMASLFLVGWMVHFWNATYVLFMFLMGSGVWLLDSDASGPATLASRRMRRAPRRPSRAASPPQVQAPPPAAVDGP
ncbi:MAG TPA: O-antigen ligase domain-containing protein, partial [Arsenicitalea sp.]|nr:O-antigen ligase domain-containing protein [Arsenicitalea sp.]